MKFLIFGDLHGQMPKIHFKDFDAIIAAGDFCSDAHRPYMFQAIKCNLENPKSHVEWYDLIGKKKAKQLVLQSVKDGRKVLEKLNSFGVPVYVVPGNNDWTGYDSKWPVERKNYYKELTKGLRNIVDVHRRSLDIGEYMLIGNGISSGPEYPQYRQDLQQFTKRQLQKKKKEYERLKKKMDALFRTQKQAIFLTHNVPFNTPIDKILNKHSPRNGQHFGSLVARYVVEKHKPLVCTGGHMHEHFKAINLGKTVCINAGYGQNCNVLLTLSGRKYTVEFYGREK